MSERLENLEIFVGKLKGEIELLKKEITKLKAVINTMSQEA